jgi:hypothetical protein
MDPKEAVLRQAGRDLAPQGWVATPSGAAVQLHQTGYNLSASVISRLTGEWQQDYGRWQRRDLSARRSPW